MLKLGTQTGSLTNHIHSRAVRGQPEPEVGMAATILAWTDRYPATIIKVEPYRDTVIITVQEDKAKRVDSNGLSESQTWEYTANPEGSRSTFRRGDNGMWQPVWFNPKTKRWGKNEGNGVLIGRREKYHDFSF